MATFFVNLVFVLLITSTTAMSEGEANLATILLWITFFLLGGGIHV